MSDTPTVRHDPLTLAIPLEPYESPQYLVQPSGAPVSKAALDRIAAIGYIVREPGVIEIARPDYPDMDLADAVSSWWFSVPIPGPGDGSGPGAQKAEPTYEHGNWDPDDPNDPVECAECGHAHFIPATGTYCECPLAPECTCQGQQEAEDIPPAPEVRFEPAAKAWAKVPRWEPGGGPFRGLINERGELGRTIWQCGHRHVSVARAMDCARAELVRRFGYPS